MGESLIGLQFQPGCCGAAPNNYYVLPFLSCSCLNFEPTGGTLSAPTA
jgi:hypothetical protein